MSISYYVSIERQIVFHKIFQNNDDNVRDMLEAVKV